MNCDVLFIKCIDHLQEVQGALSVTAFQHSTKKLLVEKTEGNLSTEVSEDPKSMYIHKLMWMFTHMNNTYYDIYLTATYV